MKIREYAVSLTGVTPLLQHADDISWSDEMKRWQTDPANKGVSIGGDDRSPSWKWLGHAYHDGQRLTLPTDNVMAALLEGGALLSTGKGPKTFKAQTQSGISVQAAHWPLSVNGHEIPWKPFAELVGETDFDKHQAVASKHGFMLFVKRAKIGASKHVRVRPRFDSWSATGTLVVTDDQITKAVLSQILTLAGQYKGVGDWRPSSRKPGPWGRFTVEIEEQ